MAVVWGLAAALSYGVSDFIAQGASQREGSLRTLLYLQLVGLPVAAMLTLTGKGVPWQRVLSPTGLVGALISMELAAGTILLYRALALGPLLIVSPVASSFAAVTAALSLLSGERPSALQLTGLVVTLAGVTLAAITTPDQGSQPARPGPTGRSWAGIAPGVLSAIGAALLWGVGLWLLRSVILVLGSQTTVLVMRTSALSFVAAFLLLSRTPARLQSASSLRWLLPMAVIDTAANWFYNLGVLSGLTSIVAVITSLFSVVTMLLGYVILKERITRVQQAGILVTLVGVALVSV